MQLRKVCNHPDLFEVRPIVTSFATGRSAIADYEIKELLVRRKLLSTLDDGREVNLDLSGLVFTHQQDTSELVARQRRSLAEVLDFSTRCEPPGELPLRDVRTFEGYKRWRQYQLRYTTWMRWNQIGYVNGLKCSQVPVYSRELLSTVVKMHQPLLPLSEIDLGTSYWQTNVTLHSAIMSHAERARSAASIVEKFAFATPISVAMDMPTHTLRGYEDQLRDTIPGTEFDGPLHHASVKLRIAFPDPSLLQYDCGKLQRLAHLLRERKAGGHRVLIFTQMTKILDILELFLNFHGYIYLRLDGATKVEDRQYITERFNSDSRVFCFISSSRSGGVGIKYVSILVQCRQYIAYHKTQFDRSGYRHLLRQRFQSADGQAVRRQVRFYCGQIVISFEGGHANPCRICRAHRIGQIRDVHIYRFISEVRGTSVVSGLSFEFDGDAIQSDFILIISTPLRRHY